MPTLTPEQREHERQRAEKIANASHNGSHPVDDINLAELLDHLGDFIRKYVVLDARQRDTAALWVAHTHTFPAFDATPYLSVTSPEKRSGKSRLLEVLELVVARPWFTGRTSPAALYRKTEAEHVTLLLDESDAVFKGDKEFSEALRGLLNTGWRRGGKTTACIGQGANISTKDFSTFSPKAIAGIGALPGTVEDRAIRILMRRRAQSEPVERFRRRDAVVEALELREVLERWAVSAIPALTEARPAIPDELDDRAAEGWEPLLGISDMAGGEWPARARAAALALSVGDGREDESFGVRLLRDLRTVFKGAAAMFTRDLVAGLVAMDTAPWADIKGKGDITGKPLDARMLARVLKPYGIKPAGTLRHGDETAKGYLRADCEDAWTRYCPSPPEEASQASQASQTADTDTNDVTDVTDVTANPGMGEVQGDFGIVVRKLEHP